ncbi:hypothetical protein [Streptomyces lanatus]|uniref:Uncharacterized protein n=1 Tax=Streptomyces lanatus TaxID=66900 RepID=A0ABV1XZW1_9ACTN|nr:hypothetical protein [Streptomyces lanatus]
MAEPQKTGIKNADELITLAAAFGLTVTVETTDRETLTSYVVRFAIPVPVAYAGTELGRTIAGDTMTLLWTKAKKKGARGCLVDATVWSVVSHRKLRTLREATAAVETLGHNSAKYARDAAPLPEDVVDAPHALYIDGKLRKEGIPAERVRTFVKNRRFNGLVTHQDDDGGIVCDNRRYVPVTTEPAPAEEAPAPAAEERMHVRIANGGSPELLDSRDALDEINHAMMDGKRDVREMSEGRGNARIVYRDQRGTVELRRATAEDIAAYAPAPAPAPVDEKARRWAEGFAAKWWAEQHTGEPTDAALAAVFAHTVKPPKREAYPLIREAITALTPPAAAAPLFAALAAREAADEAADLAPSSLHRLINHMETMPLAAPPALHERLRAARDTAEGAWESLRVAHSLPAKNAARSAAKDAIVRARAAILAVQPHASRMHGTDMPHTADSIRAAVLAYMYVGATPDETDAIESGTAEVRVDCRPDTGTGWMVTARVTAGIRDVGWFLPAHPPIVVKFRRVDGRQSPADNARKVIGSMLRVDVPVKYKDAARH